MLKKFLKKKIGPFLNEGFPENILPHLHINNKIKKLLNKKRLMQRRGKEVLNFFKGKTSFMKKIESDIIKQFSNQGFVNNVIDHKWEGTKVPISFSAVRKKKQLQVTNCDLPNVGRSLKSVPEAELKGIQRNKCVFDFPHKHTQNNSLSLDGMINKHSTSIFPQPIAYFLFSFNQLRNEMTRKEVQSKKYSEYKMQLRERKKLSVFFGNLSKRDLQRSIKKLDFYIGKSNENLLSLLETRLDVALQRCFFFTSIGAARQSVSHGKIFVNHKIMTIPSYQLRPGDIISVLRNKNSKLNKSNHKNFVITDLIKKEEELIYEKQKHQEKTDWRFFASHFLVQVLAKIQFFIVLMQGEKKENRIKLQEHSVFCFMAELPYFVLQGDNQSLKRLEDIKIQPSKKTHTVNFEKQGNNLYEQFFHEILEKSYNAIKKETQFLEMKNIYLLFKNKKFYNFYFYLLLKKHFYFAFQNKQSRLSNLDFNSLPSAKMKAPHFEVSYKSETAILLYWPQKLYFPGTLDLDLIRKSFR